MAEAELRSIPRFSPLKDEQAKMVAGAQAKGPFCTLLGDVVPNKEAPTPHPRGVGEGWAIDASGTVSYFYFTLNNM